MFVMKMILPSINPSLSILENLMKYDMVWMDLTLQKKLLCLEFDIDKIGTWKIRQKVDLQY